MRRREGERKGRTEIQYPNVREAFRPVTAAKNDGLGAHQIHTMITSRHGFPSLRLQFDPPQLPTRRIEVPNVERVQVVQCVRAIAAAEDEDSGLGGLKEGGMGSTAGGGSACNGGFTPGVRDCVERALVEGKKESRRGEDDERVSKM